MNRHVFVCFDRTSLVNFFSKHIEHTAKCCGSHRNTHGFSGVHHVHAPHHSFSASQGDGTYSTATEVLLHFTDQIDVNTFVL